MWGFVLVIVLLFLVYQLMYDNRKKTCKILDKTYMANGMVNVSVDTMVNVSVDTMYWFRGYWIKCLELDTCISLIEFLKESVLIIS